MKRTLSICLCLSLIFCSLYLVSYAELIGARVVATEKINFHSTNKDIQYSIVSQKSLRSISTHEYEYTLYQLSPYGYAVLLNSTGGLMEANYSEGVISPIPMTGATEYYYCGPLTFCVSLDGAYYEIKSGKQLSMENIEGAAQAESIAKNYEAQASIIKETSKSPLTRSVDSTISYSAQYAYFMNLYNHGENTDGTCTVLALSILLGFYDVYIDNDFVPDEYRDGAGTNDAFHQHLIQYVYGNDEIEGVLIPEANLGINDYLKTRSLCAKAKTTAITSDHAVNNAGAVSKMISYLQQSKAVVASVNTVEGAPWNHTMVVYSVTYDTSSPINTATVVAHLGWGEGYDYDNGVKNSWTEYVMTAGWFYQTGYIDYFSETHTFGSYTSVNALQHKRTCSECGYEAISSHNYVTNVAGNRICRDCGRMEVGQLTIEGSETTRG